VAELEEGVAILRRVLSGLRGQVRAAG
jgi:hypothetical protein